jgi:hypothetical protein
MSGVHWFVTNTAGLPYMSDMTPPDDTHDELDLVYPDEPLFEVLDSKERSTYQRWFNTAIRDDYHVDTPQEVTRNVARLLRGGVFSEIYRWRARNGEMLIVGVRKTGNSTTEHKVVQWHPTGELTPFKRMHSRTRLRGALRWMLLAVALVLSILDMSTGSRTDLMLYICVALALTVALR